MLITPPFDFNYGQKILQGQEKGRGQRPRPANKADLWGFIVPVAVH